MKPSKILDDISIEVDSLGLKKGSPEYEKEVRARKVDKCKEMRNVNSCYQCTHYEYCSLVKEYLMDIRN